MLVVGTFWAVVARRNRNPNIRSDHACAVSSGCTWAGTWEWTAWMSESCEEVRCHETRRGAGRRGEATARCVVWLLMDPSEAVYCGGEGSQRWEEAQLVAAARGRGYAGG